MKKLLISLSIVCTVSCASFTSPTGQEKLAGQIKHGADVLQAVNDATAPINPFAFPIHLALGVVSTAAAAYGASKHRQANRLQKINKIIVNGVEALSPTDAGKAVKASIAEQAKHSDAYSVVNSAVQAIVQNK